MHTATISTASERTHTPKGSNLSNITTFDIVISGSANMENAEIFTYPSIHRFGCVGKVRGCKRLKPGYRILFSWGISSVFESDRVLAINDDAVFLGGRAALII